MVTPYMRDYVAGQGALEWLRRAAGNATVRDWQGQANEDLESVNAWNVPRREDHNSVARPDDTAHRDLRPG
jgi:hypothetical protein